MNLWYHSHYSIDQLVIQRRFVPMKTDLRVEGGGSDWDQFAMAATCIPISTHIISW